MKKKQVTCYCPAYNFPHRQGGGDCLMPDSCGNEKTFWDECLLEDGFCDYHSNQYETNRYGYYDR